MKNRNQRFFRDCGIHRGHCSAPRFPSEGEGPGTRSGYRFGMVLKDKTPGEAADEAHAASRRAFEKRPYKKTQSLPLRAVMWETTARGEKR